MTTLYGPDAAWVVARSAGTVSGPSACVRSVGASAVTAARHASSRFEPFTAPTAGAPGVNVSVYVRFGSCPPVVPVIVRSNVASICTSEYPTSARKQFPANVSVPWPRPVRFPSSSTSRSPVHVTVVLESVESMLALRASKSTS